MGQVAGEGQGGGKGIGQQASRSYPWHRFHEWAENRSKVHFYSLGKAVTRRGWVTVASTLAVVALCGLGFLNLNVQTEGEELWAPRNSTAKKNEKIVEQYFSPSAQVAATMVAVSDTSDNLLSKEYVDRMWDVREAALAVTTPSGAMYTDVCQRTKPLDDCDMPGILKLWNNDRSTYEADISTDADVLAAINSQSYPDGSRILWDSFLGSYALDDAGEVVSAEGATFYLMVEGQGEDAEDFLIGFENAMRVQVELWASEKENGGTPLDLYYLTNDSLDRELERSVGSETILFVLTYTLMTIFVAIAFTRRPYSAASTRIGLALCAAGTVGLSGFAGYGLVAAFGTPFTSLNSLLPFILLAVGIDDSFILVNAMDATDPTLPTNERVALALSRCGLSILYTSLTDLLAFLLGSTSSLPAVSYFCVYAGVSIFIDFLFQVTFFVYWMGRDLDRQKSQRADIFCCIRGAPSLKVSATMGVENQRELTPEESQGDEGTANTDCEKSASSPSLQSETVPQSDAKPLERISPLGAWMGNTLLPAVLSRVGKVVTLVITACILSVAIVGCVNSTEGFDLLDLVPDDSYVRSYVDLSRNYGIWDLRLQGIYWQDLDLASTQVQQAMLATEEDCLTLSYYQGPLSSWLSEFLSWASLNESGHSSSINSQGLFENRETFYEALNEFLSVPEFSRFQDDIATTVNGSEITVSRSTLWQVGAGIVPQQKEALTQIRDTVDASPVEPKAFSFMFDDIFVEQFFVITNELLMNFVLVGLAVFILSLTILGSLRYTLLVMIALTIVDIEVYGFIWIWGLDVNSITGIQLIMAVGLVVDSLCHIPHYFVKCSTEGATGDLLCRRDRIKKAMMEIGPSVLLGSTTSFIGMIPLAFASNTIFRSFFRMFFVIILSGALHGLFFIPVMLDLIPMPKRI